MQILDTLKNAWRVADIRKKVLYTFLIIAVFRVGSYIPVPFIDVDGLAQSFGDITSQGNIFNYLSVLTGGALEYGALFAMSVTPYINASIIMQLLAVAIPYLERLSKEGEEGRKKIAKYTRFCTVILGCIQGIAFFLYLKNTNLIGWSEANYGRFELWFKAIVIIACLTAGSAIVMWLGERIDERVSETVFQYSSLSVSSLVLPRQ